VMAGLFAPGVFADPEQAARAAVETARHMDRLSGPDEEPWASAVVEGEGVGFMRMVRGLQQRFVIDPISARSQEARRLDDQRPYLVGTFDAPATLQVRETETRIPGPTKLLDTVVEFGRKGVEVQRYKGLGEMNPDQLWETTLDPNARALLQVKVSHEDSAEETFSTLMGDIVEPRREFIQGNALNVSNLDV
jgi:DNA gyrase subunit B